MQKTTERYIPIFLLFFFPLLAHAADYVVVSTPCSLSILNQFEQPLSAAECEALGRYPAMKILNNDATLGDQLTRAIKTEAAGRTYYLLTREGGGVEGPASVYRRIFKGCVPAGDTMEIVKGRSMVLYRRYPADGGSWKAAEGERLVRQFFYGGYCYVMKIGGRAEYGWCPREQPAWKKVTAAHGGAAAAASMADTLPEALVARLKSRVDAANEAYRVYFRHFNELTGQQKTAPVWTRLEQENGLAWSLSNPYARTGELDESSRQLAQELAMLILGRPFRASYSGGVLRVEPAAQSAKR